MTSSNATDKAMRFHRYESADLTMIQDTAFWAIHARDDEGQKTSWILHGNLQRDRFELSCDVWVPDAIQAIVGDVNGYVWGITANNLLVTNAPMHGQSGWSAMAVHPGLHGAPVWHARELVFARAGGAAGEVAVCLLWDAGDLLIGTFSRRVYCWDGEVARLEYDGGAPDFAGGINDLVATRSGVFALGYGGTLVRRGDNRNWLALDTPWSRDDAAYVNVVAGVQDPSGELRVVVDGGWVLAADHATARVTQRVSAKPLGIALFQEDLYVGTMAGCYQLMGAGYAAPVKRGVAIGKLIGAGHTLLAIDAAPDDPDRAALRVWIRTRTTDRWLTRSVG